MKRNVDFEGITFRKDGVVCIHRKTLEGHGLAEIKFADLEYDSNESTLTIKPTEEPPSRFVVTKEVVGTLAIRCRSFLQQHDILNEEESKVYPVEWDDQEEALKAKIG